MNKYTELSDLQINRRIAVMVHKYSDFIEQYDNKTIYVDGNVFDPCNNPSDAMPIIIENGIAIRPYKTATPVAFNAEIGEFYGHTIYNENVLRAAMELFLLMKDEENSNGN